MKAKSLHRQTELEPHERLLVKVIRVAIADAKQTRSISRQQEAVCGAGDMPLACRRLSNTVSPYL